MEIMDVPEFSSQARTGISEVLMELFDIGLAPNSNYLFCNDFNNFPYCDYANIRGDPCNNSSNIFRDVYSSWKDIKKMIMGMATVY